MLNNYLKILALSIVAFIVLLLVTRLDEVAQFAALGASPSKVVMFALYQLPYILPVAMPISCLISSLVLFQELSHTHELTALRSAGNSLANIITPILIAGGILALSNFYIVSEMSTYSHLATRKMQNEVESVSPIILLQNAKLLKMRGASVDIMGSLTPGEKAEDVIFAIKNKYHNRLHFVIAQSLSATDESIMGKGVTLISHASNDDDYIFDPFVIENIETFSNSLEEFSYLMNRDGWRLNNDHLTLNLLLIKAEEQREKINALSQDRDISPEHFKQLSHRPYIEISRIFSEIARRISAAVAVFTFTLMGAAFGIDISRNSSRKRVFFVISLAAFYLAVFLAAKSLDNFFCFAATLYLIPHIVIIALSFWTIRRATRGME